MTDARNVWGTLGGITFRPDQSPDRMGFSHAVKLAKMPKVFGPATSQYMGRDNTEIKLGFTLDHTFCVPDVEYKKLYEAMLEHVPMFLGLGSGQLRGYYLIEKLAVTITNTLQTGETLSMKVVCNLRETPDKPPLGTKAVPDPYVAVR